MLVYIDEDHYNICLDAANNYWASSKKGGYGRGLINTKDDKIKVERTGLLGEMAFHLISGLPYNFAYKKGGDKYDFIFDGKRIDVKTAAKDYGCICIVAYNGSGVYVFRELEYYVSCYIQEDTGKDAKVEVVGYEEGSLIKQLPIKGARAKGLHKNYELVHQNVKNIEKLLEQIK